MKNGIITLRVFEVLDHVADAHKITDGEWAKAAGLGHAPRVAELRQMARLDAKGDKEKLKQVGRAFNFRKCLALVNGLTKLIGRNAVNEKVLELIKDAQNQDERLLLMVLAMPEGKKDQLEVFLEMALKSELHDKQ